MIEYSETVPIQYQERKTKFKGLDLYVDERTFIPRPETELLVDVVLGKLNHNLQSKLHILELCTGSGAISIALAQNLESCNIKAIDISTQALEVAYKNIKSYMLEHEISLLHSDLFDALSVDYNKFNCIVSNPPYVSKDDYANVDSWVQAEPSIAFLAGEEGLDCIEKIIKESVKYLIKDGFLAMEIGYDQAEKVKSFFSEYGFSNIESYLDFNGFERVIIGWING